MTSSRAGEDSQSSTKATPLIVDDEAGNRVLILIFSPDGTKELLGHFPGHSGGILMELSWVLKRMGQGVGISINPGREPGFDFDPEMVAIPWDWWGKTLSIFHPPKPLFQHLGKTSVHIGGNGAGRGLRGPRQRSPPSTTMP